MLFLDGVYVVGARGTVEWFRWVRAPTTTELAELTHTIAERVGHFLQHQGLLERDGEQSFLAGEAVEQGTILPSGRRRAARCSPCKPCRLARSRSMTRWARWPGFRCMPAT